MPKVTYTEKVLWKDFVYETDEDEDCDPQTCYHAEPAHHEEAALLFDLEQIAIAVEVGHRFQVESMRQVICLQSHELDRARRGEVITNLDKHRIFLARRTLKRVKRKLPFFEKAFESVSGCYARYRISGNPLRHSETSNNATETETDLATQALAAANLNKSKPPAFESAIQERHSETEAILSTLRWKRDTRLSMARCDQGCCDWKEGGCWPEMPDGCYKPAGSWILDDHPAIQHARHKAYRKSHCQ